MSQRSSQPTPRQLRYLRHSPRAHRHDVREPAHTLARRAVRSRRLLALPSLTRNERRHEQQRHPRQLTESGYWSRARSSRRRSPATAQTLSGPNADGPGLSPTACVAQAQLRRVSSQFGPKSILPRLACTCYSADGASAADLPKRGPDARLCTSISPRLARENQRLGSTSCPPRYVAQGTRTCGSPSSRNRWTSAGSSSQTQGPAVPA